MPEYVNSELSWSLPRRSATRRRRRAAARRATARICRSRYAPTRWCASRTARPSSKRASSSTRRRVSDAPNSTTSRRRSSTSSGSFLSFPFTYSIIAIDLIWGETKEIKYTATTTISRHPLICLLILLLFDRLLFFFSFSNGIKHASIKQKNRIASEKKASVLNDTVLI